MTRSAWSSLPLAPFVHDFSWSQIALFSVGGTIAILGAAYIYLVHVREYLLSFRNVPGPKPRHWFFGDIGAIIKAAPNEVHAKWIDEYGPTYRYRVLLGGHRFFTADRVALNYILTHSDVFGKPMQVRKSMADMLGNGVLVAEGQDHRRQRRVLNPSFSPAAIREMVPVFFDKAYELKDKLLGLIDDETATEASPTPPKDEDRQQGGKKIDVMKYLGMTTIDVIGIAGFNYDFEALKQPKNELAEAFREMFSVGQSFGLVAIIQALVPGTAWIPTKRVRTIKRSQATTQRIGRRLIEEKKRAVKAAHGSGLEKGTEIGKDLLSLCIKANMGSDLRPDQRMTDDEILGQITTFMLAGNETSSTALTWLLWQLALHPDMQEKLRAECASIEDERPSLEQLNVLPFMDACIREVLRLLPPAPNTIREASQDVVIPLGTPVKGRNGELMSEIKLSKGTTCFVPIMAVNRDKAIWGEDAEEFNPSRHASLASDPSKTELANQVPGVWGNMLTFLGGTRNCIGYRFALAEIKAILFVLMRSFKFEELASKPVIEKKSAIVMRSRVVGEEKAGPQMPLCVKPLSA